MTYQRLGGVFLLLVAKRELNSTVPVSVLIFYLSHHTGAGFNYGDRLALAVRAKYTDHPNFASYNSRHG